MRKGWSVPQSPPFLLKQKRRNGGKAKRKPSPDRKTGPQRRKHQDQTQRQPPTGPKRNSPLQALQVSFHFGELDQTRTSSSQEEATKATTPSDAGACSFHRSETRSVHASRFIAVLVHENSCCAPPPGALASQLEARVFGLAPFQESKLEEILGSPELDRHRDADMAPQPEKSGCVHREQAQETSPNQRRERREGLDCSCRNKQHQGSRDVFAVVDCRCRSSLAQETPQRLRSSTLPLPQQLTRMTPQRLRNNESKSPEHPGHRERRTVAGGFGGTPPVSRRPGLWRAPSHSIHHVVNNHTLCALIHKNARDQRFVRKYRTETTRLNCTALEAVSSGGVVVQIVRRQAQMISAWRDQRSLPERAT